MNFTSENCEKILRGEKTMTRRIANPDYVGMDWRGILDHSIDVAGVYDQYNNRRIWGIGHTYAICPGRGKKAVGRIRITAIRRERLQDITPEDSIREGINIIPLETNIVPIEVYRIGFIALWDNIYRSQPAKQWNKNPEVWVLSFELVKGEI